ncbi:MAG TPA: CHAD domain-containing protein [Gaiellaceae bacterium]|nr:CHAD domain-containing protein [Gaiellaceae bacterium]
MARKILQYETRDPFELPVLHGRALPRREFRETFYDTAGGRLGRAGFVLRRRIENGKGIWRLTVVCDGVQTLDVEAPGGPVGPPEELRELVSAASAGFELAPVLRARTHASGLRVKAGSRSLAKISVSSIALLDGQRATDSFTEIELEQLAAGRKELVRLESALVAAGAESLNGAGPLERALAQEPRPELPLPSSELEKVREYIRHQYARMLAHDPGVRVGSDPEDLHQLRVAARRLRSVLKTAAPILDPAWVDEIRAELSWLGGELGPARDLDVLVPYLREEAANLDAGDRKALAPLFRKLGLQRATARKAVLKALRSERYLALLASIEAAAAGPPPGGTGTLRTQVENDFKKLRTAMRAVDEDPTDEAIHQARIRGKRARYATELLEDELGKQGAKLLSAAKDFQDAAGEHHDAVVAEARIRALLRGVRAQRTALAAGMLVSRQRVRRDAAARALPKAWRRYEDAAGKVWA